jgi:hypothetical protein
VRLERLDKWKTFIHLIGFRTPDPPAGSRVPQPLRYRVPRANICMYTELGNLCYAKGRRFLSKLNRAQKRPGIGAANVARKIRVCRNDTASVWRWRWLSEAASASTPPPLVYTPNCSPRSVNSLYGAIHRQGCTEFCARSVVGGDK